MDRPRMSRVSRSKSEAKSSYDRMSKWYDLFAGRSEKKIRDAGLRKLSVRKGERILEIGFGTGHCMEALARSVGSSGKVNGIDISEGMFSITQKRLEAYGLSDRVHLTIGDGMALPYQSDSFDAIFISFTLELFDTPEIPVVLSECRRVLRCGGRIGIVSLSKVERNNRMVVLYEWVHKRFPKYVDCRPIYTQQLLEEAGFRVLETEVMGMWGLPVDIVMAKN